MNCSACRKHIGYFKKFRRPIDVGLNEDEHFSTICDECASVRRMTNVVYLKDPWRPALLEMTAAAAKEGKSHLVGIIQELCELIPDDLQLSALDILRVSREESGSSDSGE